jgi:hypothetical protein
LVRLPVKIGALSSGTIIQLVTVVGCVEAQPQCPASKLSFQKFGLQGDGLPHEGFDAILGVNLAKTFIDNPFAAVGARRWIIELPRPAERSGRLILNPSPQEVEGFVMTPTLAAFRSLGTGLHDAVAGCIVHLRNDTRRCGALLMDTGAPGIRLVNLEDEAWLPGDKAEFVILDATQKAIASERFIINTRAHASHVIQGKARQPPGPVIFAGLTPYFAFSILYDATSGQIGFRERKPLADAPIGRRLKP